MTLLGFWRARYRGARHSNSSAEHWPGASSARLASSRPRASRTCRSARAGPPHADPAVFAARRRPRSAALPATTRSVHRRGMSAAARHLVAAAKPAAPPAQRHSVCRRGMSAAARHLVAPAKPAAPQAQRPSAHRQAARVVAKVPAPPAKNAAPHAPRPSAHPQPTSAVAPLHAHLAKLAATASAAQKANCVSMDGANPRSATRRSW